MSSIEERLRQLDQEGQEEADVVDEKYHADDEGQIETRHVDGDESVSDQAVAGGSDDTEGCDDERTENDNSNNIGSSFESKTKGEDNSDFSDNTNENRTALAEINSTLGNVGELPDFPDDLPADVYHSAYQTAISLFNVRPSEVKRTPLI